jgi:hypothetical protein
MPSCLLIVTLLRVLDEGLPLSQSFFFFFFSPSSGVCGEGGFLHQASKQALHGVSKVVERWCFYGIRSDKDLTISEDHGGQKHQGVSGLAFLSPYESGMGRSLLRCRVVTFSEWRLLLL